MPDFIPQGDNEFREWLARFVAEVAAQAGSLPLTAQERAALQGANDSFEAALLEHVRIQAAARGVCQVKNQARDTAMRLVRGTAASLQAAASVTDPQRRAMGLPVRDRTRTPAAAPHSRPTAIVDASLPLRHRLRLFDPANGNRRAKPAGALGCEVWMRLEPPRTAEGEPAGGGETATADAETRRHGDAGKRQQLFNGEQVLLGITTNGRFLHEFDGQHAGWTAHYRLRWFNRRGDKSPWSEIVSATVAG